jgi:hypothetical protein
LLNPGGEQLNTTRENFEVDLVLLGSVNGQRVFGKGKMTKVTAGVFQIEVPFSEIPESFPIGACGTS